MKAEKSARTGKKQLNLEVTTEILELAKAIEQGHGGIGVSALVRMLIVQEGKRMGIVTPPPTQS